jgi:alanine racemase
VATVQAPILQLRWMEVGEHAGYGAAFTATRRTQVAVAAIGYADGVLRSAFPRAYGSLAGRPCPVVGRISMDLTLFDVTDIPEALSGAMIEIIGPTAPIDVQAKAAGTIAYELLTRLAGRAERRHVGRA